MRILWKHVQKDIRLFAEHPNYKDIWPQFRAIPDSSLFNSDSLQNHAYVYMAGLKVDRLSIKQKSYQSIVAAMEDEETLCKMCKKIAVSHIKWNINKYHIEVVSFFYDALFKL